MCTCEKHYIQEITNKQTSWSFQQIFDAMNELRTVSLNGSKKQKKQTKIKSKYNIFSRGGLNAILEVDFHVMI